MRLIHLGRRVLRARHDDEGQDILEYALLVSLIVLVAIGAVGTVGSTIRTVYWDVISRAL
jgi:Flp pilus assembly pilin Flp